MREIINNKDGSLEDGTKYVKYLDLNKWYCIVVPKDETAYNEMCDYKVWDDEKGNVRDCYFFMKFHEDTYYIMEKYLFNFIDAESDLIITMYEEEWIEDENLTKVLEITNRMINNSDDEEFLKLAKEFRSLVEMAIELNTCVGCFF